MSGRLVLVAGAAFALIATGCKQCGNAPGGRDAGIDADAGAGAQAGSAQTEGAITGIDLRSAMILIFPEFRGANLHGAKAWVDRTLNVPGKADVGALLTEPAKQKGFAQVKVEGDTLTAARPPFELTATRAPGQLQQTLAIRLSPDAAQKLFSAPTALGSEQLQFMLPKPEGARIVRDTFTFELAYAAKPERASFLVRQLVEGLAAVGWNPDAPLNWPGPDEDGGVGELPVKTTVTLRRADTGGEIAVTRNAGEVYLKYQQPLTVP